VTRPVLDEQQDRRPRGRWWWATVCLVSVTMVAGAWLVLRGGAEHSRHERHVLFLAETVSERFGLPFEVPAARTVMVWSGAEGTVSCRYVPGVGEADAVEDHVCVVSASLASRADLPVEVSGPEGFRATFRTEGH